jgi:hypothetical protein
MTGKEFIEDRINTGSRFLASLHSDTREQIALLLEQYAALRQPPVSESVCSHDFGDRNQFSRCRKCGII